MSEATTEIAQPRIIDPAEYKYSDDEVFLIQSHAQSLLDAGLIPKSAFCEQANGQRNVIFNFRELFNNKVFVGNPRYQAALLDGLTLEFNGNSPITVRAASSLLKEADYNKKLTRKNKLQAVLRPVLDNVIESYINNGWNVDSEVQRKIDQAISSLENKEVAS